MLLLFFDYTFEQQYNYKTNATTKDSNRPNG